MVNQRFCSAKCSLYSKKQIKRICDCCGAEFLGRKTKKVCGSSECLKFLKKSNRNSWRLKVFGLSLCDFESLRDSQNGLCAICKNPEKTVIKGTLCNLSIDHDHKTGKVRGLLCSRCNQALGLFDENVDRMLYAIDYLKGH